MFKAMVVDDEKLVRTGFISLVDWPSYGIEIVCDAADSKSALQLLQQQPSIDLIFVDITMPGMSGFELMKRVQQLGAPIKFVILTCHHEFDYVQEALRLGAIDYIVKTLLNKENVDETMKRIAGRLQREIGPGGAYSGGYGGAAVLRGKDMTNHAEDIHAAFPEGTILHQLSPNLYIRYPRGADNDLNAKELQQRLHPNWEIIEVAASSRHTQEEAETLILERLEHHLFYASSQPPCIVTLRELDELRLAADNNRKLERLQTEWNQFKWLLYGKERSALNDHVMDARPEPPLLIGWMNELYSNVSQYIAWTPAEKAAFAADIPSRTWSEMSQSLSRLALAVQQRLADLSLSREVALCLIRSLQLMKQHACDNLTQHDVAEGVNMSRSYFSQCFKLFAGRSFGEVLRHVRIDRAKQLLLESNKSVYEIAGAVGFYDNKHFSRIFKERVGMYPTEYRSMQTAITVNDR